MNPFVWFFWISAMVGVSANYGDDKHGVIIFFAGTLAAILGSDVFKVFLAHKLKQYLKPKMLIRVNHFVGILLVGFGVYPYYPCVFSDLSRQLVQIEQLINPH